MIGACQVKVKCTKRRQVLQIVDVTGAYQVKVECLKRKQVLQIIDMIGACQIKVNCLKWRQILQIIDMIGSCQVNVNECYHFFKTLTLVTASSKEFLDIQATIECGFTLKCVRDAIRIYSLI